MSSTFFGGFGKFLGQSIAGPIGGMIGSELDKELFSPKVAPKQGRRINEFTLQTAVYGREIPIIYGKVKLGGNIIWSSKIKEQKEDFYQKRSKFGGRSLIASQFNYSISLAIALAEGEVDEILRVWADDHLIDLKMVNYRFYKGCEDQTPDPLIEAYQGFGMTPAFRGLCYVVIEDLPLKEYGNHIPNFTFEVVRNIKTKANNGDEPIEDRIKSMVIIPGSGEFVYDTIIQSKVPNKYNPNFGYFNYHKSKINQNNRENKADSLVSLDQLQKTCPNIEWVAPVVGWFTTSLDLGRCKIMPGVEYKDGDTIPDPWKVNFYTRDNAYLISRSKHGGANYGGTVNDLSIIRYLEELKARGYKILFYPMLFVDHVNKPWRGRITGRANQVESFFKKNQGYNKFILHYANLVKDKVDAFLIGSELIGITRIKDENDRFPGVDCLIDLAKQVKEIMGDKVKVSYAADWSEYHHSENGWYNLDPLWACNYIDFIGIDAYFPLTNSTLSIKNEEDISKGWNSGEGWDYYYEDQSKTIKKPLKPEYAWKNIEFWWSNKHVNPDGKQTSWVPKSKKIWFTEIGFPSVDLASNQPNVFFAPDSMESKFPIHSKGRVDFVSQRQALSASEKFWRNSNFLERMFVWTWDARPFPFWPDMLKIWSDGGCWSRGHWVNGKLGKTSLNSIIIDVLNRVGINDQYIEVEQLTDIVDGFIVTSKDTAKEIIDILKSAYCFTTYERDGKIKFIKKKNFETHYIEYDSLIISYNENNYKTKIKKSSINEIPKSVEIYYYDYLYDYNPTLEIRHNYNVEGIQKLCIQIPINLDKASASLIAEIILKELYYKQLTYEFYLSTEYAKIVPNDIIFLNDHKKTLSLRVEKLEFGAGKICKIKASSVNPEIYEQYSSLNLNNYNVLLNKTNLDPGATELIALKIPPLPYEHMNNIIYLGVIGEDKDWRGACVICPDNSLLFFPYEITYGIIEIDEDGELIVQLFNGELSSKNEEELKRYANLAAIGDEVVQFEIAEYIAKDKYRLSNVKRELFGSKRQDKKRFILIEHKLHKFPLPLSYPDEKIEFIVTSVGHSQEKSIKYKF